jgi:methionyl-tRNA synthetase
LPELSIKINEQLGSVYREEIPWKKQLIWGLLVSNSSLPKPTPIINKLEYEQKYILLPVQLQVMTILN